MKSFIPEHILEEVRSRADIVEVISDYVPLKAAGRNFKGLCPFHQEKTPSFTANREKQIYHCFGCGAGGNVFRFLMEKEDLPFIEAVRRLASRYQVSLPESSKTPGDNEAWNQKEVILKLNAEAAEYYHRQLTHPAGGKTAREYLEKRGINHASVENFKLGWAPDEWRGLLTHLTGKEKVSPDLLVHAGLVLKKEKPGEDPIYYDRFRGRLIFPIHDNQGRVIGFGGRVLGEGEPKYLNTSETPVYKKGLQLYGQHLARDAFRQKDHALIVEGYFDVIQCHQAGIENAVATCGTALTPQQGLSIKHHTPNAVLVFDSDAAGKTAADRGFEVLTGQGLNIRALALPVGEDPDSYIQKGRAAEFQKQLETAPSFLDYRLRRAVDETPGNTLDDKVAIVNQLLPFLALVANSVERTEWVRRISDELKIDDRGFLEQLKNTLAQKRTRVDSPRENSRAAGSTFDTEFFLLQLMLTGEEYARDIRSQVKIEEFGASRYRELAEKSYEMLDEGESIRVDRLLDRVESPESKSELSRLALAPVEFDSPARAIVECVTTLKKRPFRDRLKSLQLERQIAFREQNTEKYEELNRKVGEIKESLIPG